MSAERVEAVTLPVSRYRKHARFGCECIDCQILAVKFNFACASESWGGFESVIFFSVRYVHVFWTNFRVFQVRGGALELALELTHA